MNRTEDRPYFTVVFTNALYLIAKGYEPLRAEICRDGTGRIGYLFAPEARDVVHEVHDLKERLNAMALAARSAK